MKRIHIWFVLLLFTTTSVSSALAGWFDSSNSNNRAYSGNKQTSSSTSGNNNSFPSNNRTSNPLGVSLPFSRIHVVYTQSTKRTYAPDGKDPNGKEYTTVYVNHVSGKGTPQEVLNQHQEQHQRMMDKGFGPPQIVGQHRLEINAANHASKVEYEIESKDRHFVEYGEKNIDWEAVDRDLDSR